MLSGIMDVGIVPWFRWGWYTKSFIVSRYQGRKELAFFGPSGRVQPEVKVDPTSCLSDSAYGPIRVARRHWKESQNYGALFFQRYLCVFQLIFKIQRRVKFPTEFDALDLATEELRAKLLPASRKLKGIEKERSERRKVRKRTKAAAPAASTSGSTDVDMADATAQDANTEGAPAESKGAETEFEDEFVFRKKESAELSELVSEDIKKDIGSSPTGLYDLVGEHGVFCCPFALLMRRYLEIAIITHKGAAADAGHYMGFVKKSVFQAYKSGGGAAESSASTSGVTTTAELDELESDDDWYKFDDEKVSLFPKEKLPTLEGGGEDSSAYVLIYKTKAV